MCDIFMCDPLTKTTTDNHILVPMCIYGAINTWSSTDGHITQGKPICMMVLSQSPALSLLYISHHPSWSPPALKQPSPHLLQIAVKKVSNALSADSATVKNARMLTDYDQKTLPRAFLPPHTHKKNWSAQIKVIVHFIYSPPYHPRCPCLSFLSRKEIRFLMKTFQDFSPCNRLQWYPNVPRSKI